MLILQKDIIDALCIHAQNEYPRECCGIMLGRRQGEQRIVLKVIQTGNLATEWRQSTHFLISPLDEEWYYII